MEPNSHATSSLDQCRVITLPRHRHARGSLTVAENGDTLPFAIRRVFYLYDVPVGSQRGGHSHHEDHQLIVAVAGCFSVTLTDGVDSRRFMLSRPYEGLYIPPGIWREIDDFSSGSVCLVLTSSEYRESDYVREYADFQHLTSSKRTS